MGLLAAGCAGLIGCGGEADPTARDLSDGGVCDPGEMIVIGTAGATPIITGDCGPVQVTADRVSGNIESAASVTITGAHVTVLGKTWGTATISSDGTVINVDGIGTLTVEADSAAVVVNGPIDTLAVRGRGNVVNWNGGAALPSDANNTYTRMPG